MRLEPTGNARSNSPYPNATPIDDSLRQREQNRTQTGNSSETSLDNQSINDATETESQFVRMDEFPGSSTHLRAPSEVPILSNHTLTIPSTNEQNRTDAHFNVTPTHSNQTLEIDPRAGGDEQAESRDTPSSIRDQNSSPLTATTIANSTIANRESSGLASTDPVVTEMLREISNLRSLTHMYQTLQQQLTSRRDTIIGAPSGIAFIAGLAPPDNTVAITLDRDQELAQLSEHYRNEPDKGLFIKYQNELGIDEQGVFREAHTEAFKQLEESNLFTTDTDTGLLSPLMVEADGTSGNTYRTTEANLTKLEDCGRMMAAVYCAEKGGFYDDLSIRIGFDSQVYKAIVALSPPISETETPEPERRTLHLFSIEPVPLRRLTGLMGTAALAEAQEGSFERVDAISQTGTYSVPDAWLNLDSENASEIEADANMADDLETISMMDEEFEDEPQDSDEIASIHFDSEMVASAQYASEIEHDELINMDMFEDENFDQNMVETSDLHSFGEPAFQPFNLEEAYQNNPVSVLKFHNQIFPPLPNSNHLTEDQATSLEERNVLARNLMESVYPNGEIKSYLLPYVTIANGFQELVSARSIRPPVTIEELEPSFTSMTLLEAVRDGRRSANELFNTGHIDARNFMVQYITEQREGESTKEHAHRVDELCQFLTGSRSIGPNRRVTILVSNNNRLPNSSTCSSILRIGIQRLTDYEQFRACLDEAIVGSRGRFDLQ